MNSEDCRFGDRVALAGNKLPFQKGAIDGPVSMHPTLGEVVVVKWDNGNAQRVSLRSLVDEGEVLVKEAQLRAEATAKEAALKAAKTAKEAAAKAEQERLEAEWSEVEKKVAVKMKIAAKAIREAAALASAAQINLHEMYDATSDLENAMSSAGWSTSSWRC